MDKFCTQLLCVGIFQAYGMQAVLLLLLLSVLTLLNLFCYQVLGNAKGAVAVVISILLFKNPVTLIGIGGYTMTVMGVVAYGEAKRRLK